MVLSLDEAIEKAKSDKDIYVIGGGEIFKEAIKIADQIELSRIDGMFPDADAFFPEFSKDDWILVAAEKHGKDDRHAYPFTFETWIRREKAE